MIALQPIDQTLVSYTAGAPEFEALVGLILGNAADSSDGWDADLAAVIALFDAMDSAAVSLDPVMYEVGTAIDDFSALDVTSAFDDALTQVPALGSFLDSLKLQTVGGLGLGGLPPPPGGGDPVPPPTVCVPQDSSSSSSAPPGTIHTRIPPPSPIPIRTGCPAGTVWNPVTQKCEPCGPGYSFVAGDCVPNPAPSSSSSTTGGEPGPILPVPVPAPCPTGSVYDPVTGLCVPIAGESWGPGLTSVGGVIIPGSETQAAATLGQLAAAALGVPASIVVMIPVFGQIVGAFLAFNSLFGGDWTQEFNRWADEMQAWYLAQPVAATAYSVQQSLAQHQQDAKTGMMGEYARNQLLKVIAQEQARLDGLNACLAKGQFTSCPGFL